MSKDGANAMHQVRTSKSDSHSYKFRYESRLVLVHRCNKDNFGHRLNQGKVSVLGNRLQMSTC